MIKYMILLCSFLLLSHTVEAVDDLPELDIKPLADGVFIHRSFQHIDGFGLVSSNGLIVIEEDNAFIIDTPWSEQDTQDLVEWLDERGFQLVGSLSTHSHEDRTAGIEWLNNQGIATYATSLTNQLLRQDERAAAIHTFEHSPFSIAHAGMEGFYPGGGHAIDNIVVWLPKSKVLFGGCLVRSLASKGLGYTGEAKLTAWPKSIAQLLLRYKEAEIVVPGHGSPGDVTLLQHTQTLAEHHLEAGKID